MKKDKARDIARGVLPSTARKGARDDKRNFHAKHRHAQRQVNHAIARHCATVSGRGTISHDPDLYDDFEDPDIFDGYAASTKTPGLGWDDLSQSGEIIYSRRAHDKLGPLISWARATERDKMGGWDNEDKYNYFKAVLPDTLQGRHALGHVESALRIYRGPVDRRFFRYTPPEPSSVIKNKLRAKVETHLSTTKKRRAFRDFLLETVPVAGHTKATANKVLTSAEARDTDGNPRYRLTRVSEYDPVLRRTVLVRRPRPFMVDVYVPQTVAISCEDCTFLRSDPFATPETVSRLVDILWGGRDRIRRRPSTPDGHSFINEIYKHVVG